MIKAHAGAKEMRSWLEDDLATPGDFMIVGYLELRAIEVRHSRDQCLSLACTTSLKNKTE